MRYEVQQQIEEIDKALAIIGMKEIPDMKVTEEQLSVALKKAESCMRLTMREMIRQDKTMKEIYHT